MEIKGKHSSDGNHSSRDRLLPLMFEMGRLLKSEMTRDDASLPSYLHIETLRFIQEKNTPTMSEIAEYLKIAPPTATALMNPFVKEGVIERTEDIEDRRRVRLSLSTKGVELLKQTMLKRKKAFEQVTSSLSDHDVEELSRILKIITQN